MCEHYVRRCSLVAPCCNKVYVCRHCHNDAETHEMDRHAVKELICHECNQQQPVSQTCNNEACGITFCGLKFNIPVLLLLGQKVVAEDVEELVEGYTTFVLEKAVKQTAGVRHFRRRLCNVRQHLESRFHR